SGARVLIGRSYESAQIVPFAPWVDALRRGGIADDELARGLEPTWRREVARLLPELAEPGHDLAEAPNDAGRVFESMARLLDAFAAREPVVILLEDVHYADEMSAGCSPRWRVALGALPSSSSHRPGMTS